AARGNLHLAGGLKAVHGADEIIVEHHVRLKDEVGVVEAAANQHEVVVVAQIMNGDVVEGEVLAGRHGRRHARGSHDMDVAVHDKIELLAPVDENEIASDLGHRPVLRKWRVRGIGGGASVRSGVDSFELREVEG